MYNENNFVAANPSKFTPGSHNFLFVKNELGTRPEMVVFGASCSKLRFRPPSISERGYISRLPDTTPVSGLSFLVRMIKAVLVWKV